LGNQRPIFISASTHKSLIELQEKIAMVTVNFDAIDNFRTPVFKQSGLTITGSADVTNDRVGLSGVGVFGGWRNDLIDGSEIASFSFERGAATNVSYEVGLSAETGSSVNGIPAEATITAQGVRGNFLGIHRISGREVNVSALFNNEPISAFHIRGNGDVSGFNVRSLTFTPGFSNITVDLLDDENDGDFIPGDISLREAIFAAADGGTVNFDPSLTGGAIPEGIASRIALTLGEIAIDKNLTINGLGANNLTISGSKESKIFRIGGNTQVNINGLTLTDGFSQEDGGAIDNRGILNLSNSTIRDSIASDDGGGINNLGTLRLNNSTLSNNIASDDGGGIGNFGGRVEVNNSTFSNNAAESDGGGIFNFNGTVQLVSSTLTNNAVDKGNGGGIRNFQGTTSVNNTIIAGNFDSGEESPDVDGRFTSNGFNLIGIVNGSTGFSNGVNRDIVGTSTTPIDPRLTPLQNNGGSTFTHALLPGSRAIDNGNSNTTGIDQRGASRPQGFAVDIGAVEAEFQLRDRLTVDTLIDEFDGDLAPGDVSLREAIFATAAGGTIDFDSSLTGGTIRLKLGELALARNLNIQGLGANNLTISGNNTSHIFNVDDGNSNTAINLIVDGITLTEGATNDNGGAIYNRENLTLLNSIITTNTANFGGGIFNLGTATVRNSTIDSNTANSHGGGILNRGNLNVDRSTIFGNLALVEGGGINNDGGTLTVTNSTINSNLGQTYSGAIDNDRGTATIINSTISDNFANNFGGIAAYLANTTVINSTITANVGNGDGNGLFNGTHSTTTVTNSIVAGNWNNNDVGAIASFTSGGNNLIGNGDGVSGFTNGLNGDIVGTAANPIDPLIGTLQDNGGATFTHALLAGSLAIDAGNNSNAPTTDQRGITRPQDAVDIGAFELVGNAITSFDPVVNGGSAQSGISHVPFGTLRDDLLPIPNRTTKFISDNLGANLLVGNTTELLFA
jgi:hypothetical protein